MECCGIRAQSCLKTIPKNSWSSCKALDQKYPLKNLSFRWNLELRGFLKNQLPEISLFPIKSSPHVPHSQQIPFPPCWVEAWKVGIFKGINKFKKKNLKRGFFFLNGFFNWEVKPERDQEGKIWSRENVEFYSRTDQEEQNSLKPVQTSSKPVQNQLKTS